MAHTGAPPPSDSSAASPTGLLGGTGAPEPGASSRPVADERPGSAAARFRSALRAGFLRLRPWVPWGSLLVGLLSALLMDRGPQRASLVAAAAGALWLALVAFHFALRSLDAQVRAETASTRGRARWLKLAQLSTLTLTQSLTQLCLFFSLPLYFRAAVLVPNGLLGHWAFLGALAVLSGVALWDPWTEALFRRRYIAPLLPAVASFAAINVVLPALGVSTAASLWLAALAACVGVTLLATASARPGRMAQRAAYAALASLALPLALVLGLRRAIPPAPLRLVRAEMGVQLAGRWVESSLHRLYTRPERLICATAIASPVGVRDRIFHVWEKDGKELSRRAVRIVGGREEGYRTRSWWRGFGADPNGSYACRVETAADQVLGACRVVVDVPDPQPSGGLPSPAASAAERE